MALKLNESILAIIRKIATVKGNRFASLLYTAKESGELARHTILIGFDYQHAVEKSFEELNSIHFEDGSLEAQAQEELLASFQKTLTAHAQGQQNADYTKKDIYDSIELDGQLISGIKYNTNDGTFKLFGLSVSKVVLKNGVFKEVKSKPLTLAKNELRKKLPIGKFREFSIETGALEMAKVNGDVLEM
jgi:hypothetical protein